MVKNYQSIWSHNQDIPWQWWRTTNLYGVITETYPDNGEKQYIDSKKQQQMYTSDDGQKPPTCRQQKPRPMPPMTMRWDLRKSSRVSQQPWKKWVPCQAALITQLCRHRVTTFTWIFCQTALIMQFTKTSITAFMMQLTKNSDHIYTAVLLDYSCDSRSQLRSKHRPSNNSCDSFHICYIFIDVLQYYS